MEGSGNLVAAHVLSASYAWRMFRGAWLAKAGHIERRMVVTGY